MLASLLDTGINSLFETSNAAPDLSRYKLSEAKKVCGG